MALATALPFDMRTILTIISFLMLSGCSRQAEATIAKTPIKIDGIKKLTPLMEKWSSEYYQLDSNIEFSVLGSGHEAGFERFISGSTNFFITNQSLTIAERSMARGRGIAVSEKIVAIDGLAMVVKNTSTCEILTPAHIRSIFTGEINNWKEITGFDHPVSVVYNNNAVSENFWFRKKMLNMDELINSTISVSSNAEVLDLAETDDNVIGLVSITDALLAINRVKTISIVNELDKPIPPTASFIKNGGYPLSQSVFVYHLEKLNQKENDFINYCLSMKGQKKLLRMGVMPVVI